MIKRNWTMTALVLTLLTLTSVGFVDSFFVPSSLCRALHSKPNPSRGSRSNTIVASAGDALVVQNKGGGHGELGYHLALNLIEKGATVTLLQDNTANTNKEPFASYGNLESKGVKIIWGDFSEGVGKLIPEGFTFDYVFDNYAKDVETCQDVASNAQAWGVKNYVYVSSGGMYKDNDEVPFTESSNVKETGQRLVEKHLADLGLPWTSFRPQYIYGPLTNKRDYLDWFFDRVVHDIEIIPLPVHGDQLVTLTHAEDVASMMASVIGNENAVNQVFNCASDRYVSYSGLFEAVAKVVQPTVSKMAFLYDPSDHNIRKGWFPFRNNHFFVNSEKAKRLLNWKPKHTITDDLAEYFEGYKATGKHQAEPDFTQDDAINLSWHHDYVPYMVRLEERRKNPNVDNELAEMAKTFDPVDRHHYSAILESMKETYRKANPDEPDLDAELQMEYEAYVAAHPGLAERLAREDEEEAQAYSYATMEELEELIARRLKPEERSP